MKMNNNIIAVVLFVLLGFLHSGSASVRLDVADLKGVYGAGNCIVPGPNLSVVCSQYSNANQGGSCPEGAPLTYACGNYPSSACNSSQTHSTANCENHGSARNCGGTTLQCTFGGGQWTWQPIASSANMHCGQTQAVVSGGQFADHTCNPEDPGD